MNFFEFHRRGGPRATWPSSASARLDEAIGHAELLDTAPAVDHWKAARPRPARRSCTCRSCPRAPPRRRTTVQDHGLDKALDNELIALAADALEHGAAGARSSCRSATSTAPSARCSAPRSPAATAAPGLPDDTIDITLTGSAGQSFGAFLPRGITLRLVRRRQRLRRQGPVRRPHRRPPGRRRASFVAERNVIAGNVIALRRHRRRGLPARPGRRAVLRPQLRRHGGRRGRRRPRLRVHDRRPVVVLGPTGRNFAAGMSGGIAYVLDLRRRRGSTPRWSTSSRSTPRTSTLLHDLVRRHVERHRLGRSARRCSTTGRDAAGAVHQGDAARLQARCSLARREAAGGRLRRGRRDLRRDHGGVPWLTRRAS